MWLPYFRGTTVPHAKYTEKVRRSKTPHNMSLAFWIIDSKQCLWCRLGMCCMLLSMTAVKQYTKLDFFFFSQLFFDARLACPLISPLVSVCLCAHKKHHLTCNSFFSGSNGIFIFKFVDKGQNSFNWNVCHRHASPLLWWHTFTGAWFWGSWHLCNTSAECLSFSWYFIQGHGHWL